MKNPKVKILPSYIVSTIKEEQPKKSPLEKDNKKQNKKNQTKFIY
jgi:hypothetical protein